MKPGAPWSVKGVDPAAREAAKAAAQAAGLNLGAWLNMMIEQSKNGAPKAPPVAPVIPPSQPAAPSPPVGGATAPAGPAAAPGQWQAAARELANRLVETEKRIAGVVVPLRQTVAALQLRVQELETTVAARVDGPEDDESPFDDETDEADVPAAGLAAPPAVRQPEPSRPEPLRPPVQPPLITPRFAERPVEPRPKFDEIALRGGDTDNELPDGDPMEPPARPRPRIDVDRPGYPPEGYDDARSPLRTIFLVILGAIVVAAIVAVAWIGFRELNPTGRPDLGSIIRNMPPAGGSPPTSTNPAPPAPPNATPAVVPAPGPRSDDAGAPPSSVVAVPSPAPAAGVTASPAAPPVPPPVPARPAQPVNLPPSVPSPPARPAPPLAPNTPTSTASALPQGTAVTDPKAQADFAEAARQLREAANQGVAGAQYNLGVLHYEGNGVSRDPAEAGKWFQRAATQGLATAQYALGAMYDKGVGLKEDPAQAFFWFSSAAEQNHVNAMFLLAVQYSQGRGVTQDFLQAAKWFERAGQFGHANALYNLGIMAERGLGLKADDKVAYRWYGLAAKQGDRGAAAKKTEMATRLAIADLAQTDREVAAWTPRPIVADGRIQIGVNAGTAGSGAGVAGVVAPPRTANGVPAAADPQRIVILPQASMARAQALLAGLGFDPGPADGFMGERTRKAIMDFQKAIGLPADGAPSQTLLAELERVAPKR